MPSRNLWLTALVCGALAGGCAPGASRTSPGTPSDLGALAAAYAAGGRWVEAAREIGIALRRRPEDPALRLQAAEIHERVGALLRASEDLETATRVAPQSAEAWAALAAFEARRGRVDPAYVAARRAHQLAPDDPVHAEAFARAAEAAGVDENAVRRPARPVEQ